MYDLQTIVHMNAPKPAQVPNRATHPTRARRAERIADALFGRKQITKDATEALIFGQPFRRGNTEVILRGAEAGGTVAELFLHGTAIARRYMQTGTVLIRHQGYQTNTTKERLNGVLQAIGRAVICQKDFRWYRGDALWDREGANWTKVA